VTPAAPTAPPAKKPGKDRPLRLRDKVLIALVSLFGALLLRFWKFTMRFEERGRENVDRFWSAGEHVIVAFWHDRLIMLPFVYRGPKGIRVLISSSRDGELIARTIGRFGLEAVRGSSTRGGAEARDVLEDALAGGYDVGITPDGPKGPRHIAKAGVVQLAQATGRPVVPLLMSSARGKRLRSWDRFLVPMPFDHVVLRWGEPMWVDKQENFEAARRRIEDALNAVCRQVDAETGNPEVPT
jgi:lysophospholipid acyltransferase (LPLAT)-like uncharacterized protein